MKYWLLKTEPDAFSIDDLAELPDQTTNWDGVRNYQARNFIRDDMATGDQILFYHSNANPPGIVGTAEIVREGYPDETAFDPAEHHYDPKSKRTTPTWYCVDIRFTAKFSHMLDLASLRGEKSLEAMVLLQKGSRLSVQPVSAKHYRHIVKLAKQA